MKNTIKINLPIRLIEALNEALWTAQDCGPDGEGWASDELMELRQISDDILEKYKSNLLKLKGALK